MDPVLLALLVALLAMIGWCVYRVSRRSISVAAVRDWSIYAVVGLLIVVGICLSVGAHIDTPTLMEWVTPIVTAGFVFGFPARTYWPYARRPAFCATLFPLILLHFLFFLVVLPFVWRGNPLLVAILGLPEMFITYIALILVLRKPPRPPG